MIILGISCYYHDSAAAIIENGKIIAAAQEERFTRKKQDNSFPINSIYYCLFEMQISIEEVDAVVYYESPILKLDRWISTAIARKNISKQHQENQLIKNLSQKLNLTKEFRENFEKIGKQDKLHFVQHHYSHAASAFFPSPFKKAAVLILDGVGEWATTSIGIGSNNNLKLIEAIDFPNSLGLVYSAFTTFCGFKVNSGEYKLMGLAPYGEPKYVDTIKEKIISIKEDGSFSLNMNYFSFMDSDIMTNQKFEELFNTKAREQEAPLNQIYMDIASSIQLITEEIIIKLAKYAKKLIGEENLVLAGGVALNCCANGKLLSENIFKNIWIQPASGDAGGSLGAALAYYYSKTKEQRVINSNLDSQEGSYLGPSYSKEEIKQYLDQKEIPFKEYKKNETAIEIASLLSNGKVIALFNGRMEYGPRALGSRSIIGDPRDPKMQTHMNLKIKFRESFRPFAPAVLEEDLEKYFDLNVRTPYMLQVAKVKENRCNYVDKKLLKKEKFNMLNYLNQLRSDIPAITHVDYSARIQSVNKSTNEYFYSILNEFKKLTGYSVCINTSFNVRGEPIVCTPEDAFKCFMRTDIDVLVIENFILLKNEQKEYLEENDWRDEYELD